jgi:short-subunit dehydrogenase
MSVFKGKIVWLTGASSGIGFEIALQLAHAGASIILSSRNTLKLEELLKSLERREDHMIVSLDLENSSGFDVLAEKIISKYGRIDYLINNGGVSQRSEVVATPIEIDRRIMEVNYFGNIALTKAVLPYFRKQRSGHVVVVSSISGKFGFFLRSAYSASKHALHGFYESLLLEEEKNGLSVTLVCPGKINTDISVNALNADGEAHGKRDHNQSTGMSAAQCASLLLKAVAQNKKEILIGNKEIKAVKLKRFLPKLFWKVIKKQSPT